MYKDYGFQIQAFRFILGFSFCLIWIKHGYTVALLLLINSVEQVISCPGQYLLVNCVERDAAI